MPQRRRQLPAVWRGDLGGSRGRLDGGVAVAEGQGNGMEAGSRAEGGKAERVWRGGGARGHTGSGLIRAEWGAGCQARRSPEAAEAVPERKGKIYSFRRYRKMLCKTFRSKPPLI